MNVKEIGMMAGILAVGVGVGYILSGYLVKRKVDEGREALHKGDDAVKTLKKQYPDKKTRPKSIEGIMDAFEEVKRFSAPAPHSYYTSSYYVLADPSNNRGGGEPRIATGYY